MVSNKVVTLAGGQSYLETNELFDIMGLRRHTLLRNLFCICGRALLVMNCFSHAKSHGIVLTTNQMLQFFDVIASMDLVKEMDEVPIPTNGGPPVELVKQVPNGHCCDYCTYCVPSQKAMDNHWARNHKNERMVSRAHRYHFGTIQTLFYPVGEHYFEVNPALSGLDEDDMFAIYLRDEVPKIPPFPATGPQDSRDVNPLLKATEWHVHLQDYTKDRRTRDTLRSLVQLPPSQAKTGLATLGHIATLYLKAMRSKAMSASFAMRCLLMECPR
jgi:hypothetical protein